MRFLNKLGSGVRNISHRFLGFLENWTAPLTLMVLAAVLVLSIWFWDSWSGKEESVGMALRNLVLVKAAIAALPLAIWRSKVAQLGLMNDRYQKGAEMLGNNVLAVRPGGIYALARLAREHPGEYHTQIMGLFCAFVRNPLVVEKKQDANKSREDVQAVMTAIGKRDEAQIEIEEREGYRMNLNEADLWKANLRGTELHEVNLEGANLHAAELFATKLTGGCLIGAELHEAFLATTNLSNADMRDCIGLTQEQIDQAIAQKDHPPKLTGAVDANTGEPLVWRGGTPNG